MAGGSSDNQEIGIPAKLLAGWFASSVFLLLAGSFMLTEGGYDEDSEGFLLNGLDGDTKKAVAAALAIGFGICGYIANYMLTKGACQTVLSMFLSKQSLLKANRKLSYVLPWMNEIPERFENPAQPVGDTATPAQRLTLLSWLFAITSGVAWGALTHEAGVEVFAKLFQTDEFVAQGGALLVGTLPTVIVIGALAYKISNTLFNSNNNNKVGFLAWCMDHNEYTKFCSSNGFRTRFIYGLFLFSGIFAGGLMMTLAGYGTTFSTLAFVGDEYAAHALTSLLIGCGAIGMGLFYLYQSIQSAQYWCQYFSTESTAQSTQTKWTTPELLAILGNAVGHGFPALMGSALFSLLMDEDAGLWGSWESITLSVLSFLCSAIASAGANFGTHPSAPVPTTWPSSTLYKSISSTAADGAISLVYGPMQQKA